MQSIPLSVDVPPHMSGKASPPFASPALFRPPPSPVSTARAAVSDSPSSLLWMDRTDSASSVESLEWSASSASSTESSVSAGELPLSQEPEPCGATDANHRARRVLAELTNTALSLTLPPSQPLTKQCPLNHSRPAQQPLGPLSCATARWLSLEHHHELLVSQHRHQCYNPAAAYLPYRALLLSWLLECGASPLHLPALTTHSAVGLLDHLASLHPIPLPSLQLIALTAVLLSAKFTLPWDAQPSIPLLLSLAPGLYSAEQLRDAELAVLTRLQWTVDVVTPMHFLDAWQAHPASLPGHADLWRCVRSLERSTLAAYHLRRWTVCVRACGLLYAARLCVGLPSWSVELARVCGCVEEQVMACGSEVLTAYDRGQQTHGPRAGEPDMDD